MLFDCDQDQLRALLDHQKGLKCLPFFAKEVLRQQSEWLSAQDDPLLRITLEVEPVDHYTDGATPILERLQFIQRYIEPLANGSGESASEEFASLCRKAANSANPDEWQRMLGIRVFSTPMDTNKFESDLWAWASDQSHQAELRLLCLTVWWAARGCYVLSRYGLHMVRLLADDNVQVLTELAGTVGTLGHVELGLASVEECLGLSSTVYEDRHQLQHILWQRTKNLGYEAAIKLVLMLHQLLIVVPERGYRASAWLYEAQLGMEVSSDSTVDSVRTSLRVAKKKLGSQNEKGDSIDDFVLLIVVCLGRAYEQLASDMSQQEFTWQRASTIIEAMLDLPESALDEAIRDQNSKLVAVLEARLGGCNTEIATTLLLQLARAWSMTPAVFVEKEDRRARGLPSAVVIMEAWLNIKHPADYSPGLVRKQVLSRLGSVERSVAHEFIVAFSGFLRLWQKRGPKFASTVCDEVLDLVTDPVLWSESVKAHTAFLPDRPGSSSANSQNASPDTVACDVNEECEAVASRVKAAVRSKNPRLAIPATVEIVNWLQLPPEALVDTNDVRLRECLRKSPIARCDTNTAAVFLSVLADAVPWMGCSEHVNAFSTFGSDPPVGKQDWLSPKRVENAYRILLNWLTLDLPDNTRLLERNFSEMAGFREEFREASRLTALAPSVASCFLTAVADVAYSSGIAGKIQDASVLLESWLDKPISLFTKDARIQSLSPQSAVAYGMTWLRCTNRLDSVFVEFCDSLVEYIRSVRDEKFASWEQRQEFSAIVDLVGHTLKTACNARTIAYRLGSEDSPEADDLERHMLEWLEQIEFRQLLERRFYSYASPDPVGTGTAEKGKEWPFLHVGNSDKPQASGNTPSLQQVLGTSEASVSSLPRDTNKLPDFDPLLERRRRELLEQSEVVNAKLDHLIPPGCVWIRTDFGLDQSLHWWAYYRPPDGGPVGVRLHGGRSEAEALEQIESATAIFDMAVECAWARYLGFELQPQLRIPVVRMAKRYVKSGPWDRGFSSIGFFTGALGKLKNAGYRHLAGAGKWLLPSTDTKSRHAKGRIPKSQAEAFGRFVRSLDGSWPEPHGSEQRERRRKEELDTATKNFMEAVGGQFANFDGLWEAGLHRANNPIDWSKTDILFTVGGPLHAAPLAWLPFGPDRKALYKSVASTSSVVSLTLRSVAEFEAANTPPASGQILSAHFLKKDAWQKGATGLAKLHAELASLCRKRGWRILGFGDDPEASVANVRACLAAERDRGFRLLVIGGHGADDDVGVCLSDGVWKGDGPLHRVDLVVLCACAVGRLNQPKHAFRDAEGLCTQVVANGGRCVLAARNPIADREAARFLTAFVQDFLATENGGPFAAARALNRVRQALVTDQHDTDSVSAHLAGSFEILGTV